MFLNFYFLFYFYFTFKVLGIIVFLYLWCISCCMKSFHEGNLNSRLMIWFLTFTRHDAAVNPDILVLTFQCAFFLPSPLPTNTTFVFFLNSPFSSIVLHVSKLRPSLTYDSLSSIVLVI